ncbi:hypothetical protein T439DRAFT_375864 [Meredithblackwellia eburnea MCA 4105]
MSGPPGPPGPTNSSAKSRLPPPKFTPAGPLDANLRGDAIAQREINNAIANTSQRKKSIPNTTYPDPYRSHQPQQQPLPASSPSSASGGPHVATTSTPPTLMQSFPPIVAQPQYPQHQSPSAMSEIDELADDKSLVKPYSGIPASQQPPAPESRGPFKPGEVFTIPDSPPSNVTSDYVDRPMSANQATSMATQAPPSRPSETLPSNSRTKATPDDSATPEGGKQNDRASNSTPTDSQHQHQQSAIRAITTSSASGLRIPQRQARQKPISGPFGPVGGGPIVYGNHIYNTSEDAEFIPIYSSNVGPSMIAPSTIPSRPPVVVPQPLASPNPQSTSSLSTSNKPSPVLKQAALQSPSSYSQVSPTLERRQNPQQQRPPQPPAPAVAPAKRRLPAQAHDLHSPEMSKRKVIAPMSASIPAHPPNVQAPPTAIQLCDHREQLMAATATAIRETWQRIQQGAPSRQRDNSGSSSAVATPTSVTSSSQALRTSSGKTNEQHQTPTVLASQQTHQTSSPASHLQGAAATPAPQSRVLTFAPGMVPTGRRATIPFGQVRLPLGSPKNWAQPADGGVLFDSQVASQGTILALGIPEMIFSSLDACQDFQDVKQVFILCGQRGGDAKQWSLDQDGFARAYSIINSLWLLWLKFHQLHSVNLSDFCTGMVSLVYDDRLPWHSDVTQALVEGRPQAQAPLPPSQYQLQPLQHPQHPPGGGFFPQQPLPSSSSTSVGTVSHRRLSGPATIPAGISPPRSIANETGNWIGLVMGQLQNHEKGLDPNGGIASATPTLADRPPSAPSNQQHEQLVAATQKSQSPVHMDMARSSSAPTVVADSNFVDPAVTEALRGLRPAAIMLENAQLQLITLLQDEKVRKAFEVIEAFPARLDEADRKWLAPVAETMRAAKENGWFLNS